MINVTCNEESIHIEYVDEQNGTGTIHSLVNLVKKRVCNRLKRTVICQYFLDTLINFHLRVWFHVSLSSLTIFFNNLSPCLSLHYTAFADSWLYLYSSQYWE
ncbi:MULTISPECIES: small, acid-soluble spore protein, H family [Peribacillus]|nr:small, acid-soluble spore protein, H family [Peribacillus frigoritolerans]MEC0344135.1 small, acid-soluble spore protein, H family [Peribacillus castrilensis]